MCFVTPYHPAAAFTVGNAMGRNKVIYGLSDQVLVVAADLDKGGTWAGATEALKKGWGDVRVWTGSGTGEGNSGLVGRGDTCLGDRRAAGEP